MALSLPVANVIGGAVSGGASILGSIMSHITARKQIAAQQKENQLNRQFNAREAALSRQHTLDMWNRNNSYNDPSSAMQRLITAGIHPALAFSQGTQGFSATMASSPAQAGYSGGISPVMPDYSGISNAGRAAGDALESISNSSLANQQAGLTEQQRAYYNQFAEGSLELLGANIVLVNNNARLSAENKRLVATTADEIEQRINIVDEFGREMARDQAAITKFEADYKRFIQSDNLRNSIYTDWRFDSEMAQFGITSTQAMYAAKLAEAEILLKIASAGAQSADSRLKNAYSDIEEYRNNLIKKMDKFVPGLSIGDKLRDLNESNSIEFHIDNYWASQWFKVFGNAVDKAGDAVIARYGKRPGQTFNFGVQPIGGLPYRH